MKCRYNKKPFIYNYVADYKTADGQDRHQSFQMPSFSVSSPADGARALKHMLIKQGYAPVAIVYIKGNYTIAELDAMADGKAPIPREAVNIKEFSYI